MRLAVVVKYYPPMERVSGIVGFLSVLLRRLADRHEIHVVTHRPRADGRSRVDLDGVDVHRVRGPFPVAAALEIRRIDPDLVLFVSGIFRLRLSAPYFGAFDLLTRPSLPRLFMQATHPDRSPDLAMRLALRKVTAILTTSEEIEHRFRSVFGDRVRLLEPAVELPPRTESEPEGRFRIGFVNHLNQVKGADIASACIRDLLDDNEHVEAVIAGTGDLSDEIAAAHENDDRVAILGFVADEERLTLIESCDVMLLPFRQAVSVLGVSQTVLEVMAAGRVVVGSATASITPAITDGVNGVLADLDDFVTTTQELIDDRDRLARLGRQARLDAAQEWDIAHRANQLVTLARDSIQLD